MIPILKWNQESDHATDFPGKTHWKDGGGKYVLPPLYDGFHSCELSPLKNPNILFCRETPIFRRILNLGARSYNFGAPKQICENPSEKYQNIQNDRNNRFIGKYKISRVWKFPWDRAPISILRARKPKNCHFVKYINILYSYL